MTETRANPRLGETWRHCKGTFYVIRCITRDTEGDRPHRVVYFDPSQATPEYHDRLLSMFMDRHSSGAWRFEFSPLIDRMSREELESERTRLQALLDK